MLLAMLSSLYFVVLYNHLNISHRECSRIGGPFDVLYTGTPGRPLRAVPFARNP